MEPYNFVTLLGYHSMFFSCDRLDTSSNAFRTSLGAGGLYQTTDSLLVSWTLIIYILTVKTSRRI